MIPVNISPSVVAPCVRLLKVPVFPVDALRKAPVPQRAAQQMGFGSDVGSALPKWTGRRIPSRPCPRIG